MNHNKGTIRRQEDNLVQKHRGNVIDKAAKKPKVDHSTRSLPVHSLRAAVTQSNSSAVDYYQGKAQTTTPERNQVRAAASRKRFVCFSLFIFLASIVGVALIIGARVIFDATALNSQYDEPPIPVLYIIGIILGVCLPSLVSTYIHWTRKKVSDRQTTNTCFQKLERIEDAIIADRYQYKILPIDVDQKIRRQQNRMRKDLPPNKRKITHVDLLISREEAEYFRAKVEKLKRKRVKKKRVAKQKIKEAKNEARKAKLLGDQKSYEIAHLHEKKAKKDLRKVRRVEKRINKAKEKYRKHMMRIDALRDKMHEQQIILDEQVRMQLLERY